MLEIFSAAKCDCKFLIASLLIKSNTKWLWTGRVDKTPCRELYLKSSLQEKSSIKAEIYPKSRISY